MEYTQISTRASIDSLANCILAIYIELTIYTNAVVIMQRFLIYNPLVSYIGKHYAELFYNSIIGKLTEMQSINFRVPRFNVNSLAHVHIFNLLQFYYCFWLMGKQPELNNFSIKYLLIFSYLFIATYMTCLHIRIHRPQ